MRKILAFVVFSLWVVGVGSAAQIPSTVDYDTLFKLDSQARIKLFNQLTQENRAALVREHMDRWVEANRARLTPPQLEVLKANAAFHTPDKFGATMTEQFTKEVTDLSRRTHAVLSPEEVRQAMTLWADYIPKKSAGSTGVPR